MGFGASPTYPVPPFFDFAGILAIRELGKVKGKILLKKLSVFSNFNP